MMPQAGLEMTLCYPYRLVVNRFQLELNMAMRLGTEIIRAATSHSYYIVRTLYIHYTNETLVYCHLLVYLAFLQPAHSIRDFCGERQQLAATRRVPNRPTPHSLAFDPERLHDP